MFLKVMNKARLFKILLTKKCVMKMPWADPVLDKLATVAACKINLLLGLTG